MKKILTIAIACTSLASFTSCSDFLEEHPKSSITLETYYQTESDIVGNINYLYRNGAPDKLANMSGAYRGSSVSVAAMLTGYFQNEYEGQEVDNLYARQLNRQDYTASVCTYWSNDAWTTIYKAINISNAVLKYIDNVETSNNAKYKAEAHFFRALNYYYLVKMFGDVPMITEPTEDGATVTYPTRTPKADIYNNVILPDLKDAVANLPATTFAGNGHRVTKYAAEMLLADVYMMQKQYSEALPLLKDVIASGLFSLTTNDDLALGSAYNKLRANDDLAEVIWAYERDGQVSNSGNLPAHAFNLSAGSSKLFTTYSLMVNVFNVSKRFQNVYESNDLRIQPNQFFHWKYTNPDTKVEFEFKDGQTGNWFWYDEEALLKTNIGTKDWNFYRYAETLLSAAECIAQTSGVTSEAAGYLAQVKARANMEGKTASQIATSLQAMGKQAFIEECWKERLREFPLEMKIWDDCLRTKKFPSISTTTKGEVQFVDLIGAQNGSGATFKETDLYWPIPIEEIQRNPNLEQNTGYAKK